MDSGGSVSFGHDSPESRRASKLKGKEKKVLLCSRICWFSFCSDCYCLAQTHREGGLCVAAWP